MFLKRFNGWKCCGEKEIMYLSFKVRPEYKLTKACRGLSWRPMYRLQETWSKYGYRIPLYGKQSAFTYQYFNATARSISKLQGKGFKRRYNTCHTRLNSPHKFPLWILQGQPIPSSLRQSFFTTFSSRPSKYSQ